MVDYAGWANSWRCPACGSERGERVLDLPPVPVHVGLLWRTPAEAMSCPKGQLTLALCESCGYVWNAAFNPDLLHYEADYDNALHFSPKFAAWEQLLVDGLVVRHDLRARRIAEIGCGDGRFLSMLCAAGDNSGIGFEPGHNGERVSELVATVDVRIVDDFADEQSLRDENIDFVLSRHVLEHMARPTVLIDAIRNGLEPGAGVYVEVPNLGRALDLGAFEDMMYEHCGYYTAGTLAHLLRRHGFTNVRSTSTFDGLFAAVEATTGKQTDARNDVPLDGGVVAVMRDQFATLAARISDVDAQLAHRHERGERIVAWGGGARAVGLLNLVPSSTAIDCVVDVNPRKQWTFVTGTGHPIVPPSELSNDPPDTVVIVNSVYRDEISTMLLELGVDAELVVV